jgi:hypothetical protein
VGQKRGREEAALDPKKQFITRLLKLGQPGQLSEVSSLRTAASSVVVRKQCCSLLLLHVAVLGVLDRHGQQ